MTRRATSTATTISIKLRHLLLRIFLPLNTRYVAVLSNAAEWPH